MALDVEEVVDGRMDGEELMRQGRQRVVIVAERVDVLATTCGIQTRVEIS